MRTQNIYNHFKIKIVKILSFSLTAFIGILLLSCKSDIVKEISKDRSIETSISIDHLDINRDIIKTTHNVWVKGTLVKKIVYTDTIPALGRISQEAENNQGETRIVSVPKEYEVYITVK